MKNIARHSLSACLILFLGFALSSGILKNLSGRISDRIMPVMKGRLYHHISNLEVDAKHYFILPAGGYTKDLYALPLSTAAVATIFVNSVFNVLFQPVFICPFTPQVILNIILMPFFIYGAVKYFRKVWLMLLMFAVISFQIGIYDSVIETLIRHGMSCELIYLMIGSAGFAGWIAKKS